ncbi:MULTISPECIES: hypothetical protein [unclassified Marinobacter]|uniref:hypothetical protein n=1 Tax=unclassified Marinobacter TaxID=83889 RepID=UPI001927A69C|nr:MULTISPECIES: hypothetical protein [unclassified Marinobacter]MBL3827041.1 hypothetical protein [Marinobacter sp. MC3]MBL3895547.1 hypothetical protein [Marinobacter sp. MW3]
MKKHLLLTSLVLTLAAGNLHATEAKDDKLAQGTLSKSSIQDMKRQHRVMTQAALSEVGMEARRKLMLSNKDDIYHEMIKSGDVNLSELDQFSKDQFIH